MYPMKLFIPLSSGQSIPKTVIESIAMQTIPMDIITCCTEGVFNSNHNLSPDRTAKLNGELNSRNLAIEYFNKYYPDEKYVAMQDRDIVHLYNDNYERCIHFLIEHNEDDAVALPWKEYKVTEHIRNAAFVIRGEVFKNFKFRIDYRKHICLTMMDDIKIYFLPSDKKLINEENL